MKRTVLTTPAIMHNRVILITIYQKIILMSIVILCKYEFCSLGYPYQDNIKSNKLFDFDKLTEYFKKMIALRDKTTLEDANTGMLNKEFIQKHQHVWDSAKDKYSFSDSEIDLDGAVYYTKSVINEQMHKLGYIRR